MTEAEEGTGRARGPGHRPNAATLTQQEQEILRQVARDSIHHGLRVGRALPVALEIFPAALRDPGATFVTLRSGGGLRGCIGTFRARRPLVEDVAENAYGAAFRDPRFPPLEEAEARRLDLRISLLSPLEPLEVQDQEALLASLRPGIDGLLLEDPPRRATFLPQVWESLPDPDRFLAELLDKAGLPRDHWSPTLGFQRYTVVEF